ncbi:hypothetical protein ACH5RR_032717 [Cinchona calisaya]|uniref:High mobility group B protein 15-like n=1 Tax=Cinchona calisaya TaxID=153742 RepID=A0ABD2YIX0_9GENT
MVEVGGMKMAMTSSSITRSPLPLQARPFDYNRYPHRMATYEEVVASPQLFLVTLEKLHAAMGTKFMIPTVAGRDLDLHRLFVEVTSRGGIAKILQERKWKDIIGVFSFPSTATNASFVLRKYYFSLLLHYEQIYYFKAEGWTADASQNSSPTITPLPHELTEPMQSILVMQAATPQAQMAESAKLLPEACSAPSTGSEVHGVIDGRFESGYLITVKIGSGEFKGVLYQAALNHAPQNIVHQSSLQCQSTSGNKYRSSAVALGVARRRRRKKSEIKKRDPTHPKPNRSGYNFYFAEQHARLKPLYPGKDREISKMIGESWNKLQDSEKAIYQDKAVRDKERYRLEMEGYRERLRTGQILSCAMPIQPQALYSHVRTATDVDQMLQTKDASSSCMHEKATNSCSNGKNNLVLSTGQTAIYSTSVQQQSLRPDLNMVDVDKKVQTEDALNDSPENGSDQRNLEDHQTTEKDADIEGSCKADSEQGNASEEILAYEEATEMRKEAKIDGYEDKESSGDIAMEIGKNGLSIDEEVPAPIKGMISAPDEGNQVLPKEA